MQKIITVLWIIFMLNAFPAYPQQYSAYDYAPSDEIFNNPERGFYKYTERKSANGSLSPGTLESYRNNGYTMIYRIYYMSDYVDSPIAGEYLGKIREDFQAIRKAGIKVALRFAYTSKSTEPYGDATPAQVQEHIAQLKPILQENADVIAVMQAGFIGAWGEWYYTDYFATGSPDNVTPEDLEERTDLVYALLDALPPERQIQLRYVGYKMDFFGDQPITPEEAYNGSPKSRMAHHNDCFVSSNNDVGTYHSAYDRTYLKQDSKYISVGGETCRWYEPRSNCDTTLVEMARYHWSFINIDYYGTTIQNWKDDGCFDDIRRKLGYRYSLVSGSLQDETKQNGSFSGTLELINEGFSNPYNPRGIEIILRHKSSGDELFIPVETDIRFVPLGDTIKLELEAGIPESAVSGDYDVFLNLPDPMLSIKRDPNYSIQLANEDVWEDATGYNKLGHTLNIDPSNGVPDYEGDNYFSPLDEFAYMDTSLNPPSQLFANQYADNAVLYWGLIEGNKKFTIIERSDNGGEFETIALLSPGVTSYTDRGLTPGNTYSYRTYLSDNYTGTPYSNSVSAYPDDSEFLYPEITIDGAVNDWHPIPPTTSAFDTSTFAAFCYADTGSLNILIAGENMTGFQLWLETDANNMTGGDASTWTTQGIDFMVSADSLFHFDQGWQFVRLLDNYNAATSIYEFSIPFSGLSLDNNRIIGVGVIVSTGDQTICMPFQGSTLSGYERILPPQPPANFRVKPSSETPESKLIMTWESCGDCDGYFLERSAGDMESFELLTMLDPGEFKYSNTGLDNYTTYYYRMFSYNFAGPSGYTTTRSGYTRPVGINEAMADNEFLVFPNPAGDQINLKLSDPFPHNISICLFDFSGRQVLSLTPGNADRELTIPVSNWPAGIYLLQIQWAGEWYDKKIIIE